LRIIFNNYEAAAANLAYEEWLFDHFEEDILRIWINPPSVIVGKHQNAMAEANVPFCLDNQIPVLRRISGGGTVYHDFGNVNFSFFRLLQSERMIDYDRNLNIIKKALHQLGYPVSMSARHDLFLEDFKVSGNAQHMRKGKSLHHGTLLYDANRAVLGSAIKRENGSYIDKGVKSVRSNIANLRMFKDLGSTQSFAAALMKQLELQGYHTQPVEAPQKEIEHLVATKYALETWNFGYSPGFQMQRQTDTYFVDAEVLRGGATKKLTVLNIPSKIAAAIEGLPSSFFPSEIKAWIYQQPRLNTNQKEALLRAML
jgi:lipoate-protein ligase A